MASLETHREQYQRLAVIDPWYPYRMFGITSMAGAAVPFAIWVDHGSVTAAVIAGAMIYIGARGYLWEWYRFQDWKLYGQFDAGA